MSYNKKAIIVDGNLRETVFHGTPDFPVVVFFDDISLFEGNIAAIHLHTDIEICIPVKGTVLMQIRQQELEIKPGQAIIINSNVPHSLRAFYDKDCQYYSIIFDPSFISGKVGEKIERLYIHPFLENSNIPSVLIKGREDTDIELMNLLRNIIGIWNGHERCYELKTRGLLCQIFGRVIADSLNGKTEYTPINNPELERFGKMLEHIHSHYDSVFSLDELAKAMFLSRETCSRLFKRMSGKNITMYLEEYRVGQSLPLIRNGEYTISMIAEMCGFSSAGRFARAFRKYMGCNPREYRCNNKIRR